MLFHKGGQTDPSYFQHFQIRAQTSASNKYWNTVSFVLCNIHKIAIHADKVWYL